MTYKESNLDRSIDNTNFENSNVTMVSSNDHHKKTELEQLKEEVQNLKKIVEEYQLTITHYNQKNDLVKKLIVYLYEYNGIFTDRSSYLKFKGKILGDFIDEYEECLSSYFIPLDTKS